MTGRTIALGIGVCAVAALACAAERHRVATPNGDAALQDLGPAGDTWVGRPDGTVTVEDMKRLQAQVVWPPAQAERVMLGDGSEILTGPDGAIFAPTPPVDTAAAEPRQSRFEELLAAVPWVEVSKDGFSVITFADGSVPADPNFALSFPAHIAHREQVPHFYNERGQLVYEDGAIFAADLPTHTR